MYQGIKIPLHIGHQSQELQHSLSFTNLRVLTCSTTYLFPSKLTTYMYEVFQFCTFLVVVVVVGSSSKSAYYTKNFDQFNRQADEPVQQSVHNSGENRIDPPEAPLSGF